MSQAKEGEKQPQVVDGQPSTEYQFAALCMAVAKRHRQAVLDVLACVVGGPKKPPETPSKASKTSKAQGLGVILLHENNSSEGHFWPFCQAFLHLLGVG